MWMIWGYPHDLGNPWKPPLSALLCEYLAPFVEMIYEIKLICLAIYSVFGCGHGKDIKHRLDNCKFERCAAPCSLSCRMILDSLFDIFLSTACHGPALSSHLGFSRFSAVDLKWKSATKIADQRWQESSLKGRFWKRLGPGGPGGPGGEAGRPSSSFRCRCHFLNKTVLSWNSALD